MKKTEQPKGPRVRETREIKLKDKVGRNIIPIDMVRVFGFVPNRIFIRKVAGSNNTIIVSAELTQLEAQREDEMIALRKKNEKLVKKPKEARFKEL